MALSLGGQIRFFKAFAYLLAVVTLLALAAGIGGGYTLAQHIPWLGLALGFATASLALPLGIGYRLMDRLGEQAAKAARLAALATPTAITLTPTGIQLLSGRLFKAEGGPSPLVTLPLPGFRLPRRKQAFAAQLYCRDGEPELVVAIENNRRYAGTALTPRGLRDEIRRTKRVALALGTTFIAIPALLGILLQEQVRPLDQEAGLARQAQKWPLTTGEVTSARVLILGPDAVHPRQRYKLEVSYRYTVGNTPYTGNRLWFGYQPEESEGEAEKALARFAMTKTVKVHYAPDNPALATLAAGDPTSLEKKLREQTTQNIFLAATLAAIALSTAALAFRIPLRKARRLLVELENKD